jgi:L-ectoine synthase
VVGPNDRHRLQLSEDSHYVSIFCPPLRGDETFDKDGGYTASGPIAPTDRRMFAKRADEMRRSGQEIIVANGRVRTLRMLTKADGIGFGFSDVHMAAGAEALLWYKHHWEANHILTGTGEVTDLGTGRTWKLEPGMAYNVGPADRHRVLAHTDMHLVSIFCPPLVGNEQHDADGALAPSGPVPPGPPVV